MPKKYKKIGQWWILESETSEAVLDFVNTSSIDGWHNHVTNTLLTYLDNEPKRVAIDCGAHYGFLSVPFAHHFEQVHSFELSPLTYSVLQANIKKYNNIRAYNIGLSNAEKVVCFNQFYNSGITKIFSVKGNDKGFVEQHDFIGKVMTLDSFEFKGVDLIKIDVEGHELELLHGATETLVRERPLIYIEIQPGVKRFMRFRETFEILMDAGYLLVALDQTSDYIFQHRTKIKW